MVPPSCCLDPVQLRKALRLVHCLQKERGASCAYYASRSQPNIVKNMERSRFDTDRAIQMMLSGRGELKVHSTLVKIRKMVQVSDLATTTTASPGNPHSHNNAGDPSAALAAAAVEEPKRSISCHRILVCFNALISSIVHDFFTEKIAFQERSSPRHQRDRSKQTSYRGSGMGAAARGGKSATFTKGHNRAKSTGDYLMFAEAGALSNHHAGSNGEIPILFVGPGSAPKDNNDYGNTMFLPATSPPETLLPPSSSNGASETPRLKRTGSFDSINKIVHFEIDPDDPEVILRRLLNQLACFVKLKESTGVERAVLSSLVVSGEEDSLLLSDLVLEVENQRRLLDDLKKLPFGSLRNLVDELVEMSQPLRELQQKILTNFDLKGIVILDPEHNVTAVWDLITVYIDKLHSLELLIIEEIEYCLPAIEKSHGGHDHHCHNPQPTFLESEFIAGLFGASASEDEIRTRLEKMPAEVIKEKILQGLVSNSSEVSVGSDHIHDFSLATVNGVIQDPFLLIPSLPPSKEWEINLYELKFLKRIGEGAAGTTYLANWTGLKVAVKVASITETGLDGWRTEVQALQKLHHPNIIRLLGSVYHPNPLTFCLVLEYCNAGELTNALKYPTAPGFFFHVATSIANGVAYLHSRGVMHRDIKPDNILCDGNVRTGKFQVKVSDFGVATDTSVLGDRTAETGTYRWMSPEVIRHESYSNMADVYSYAIVCWQLITREEPYMNLSQIEAAGKVALERARPPFPPSDTPESVMSAIQTYWSEDPDQRSPFAQICEQLPSIESGLSTEEQKWLDAPLGHPVYYPRQEHEDDDDEGSATHPPIPILAHHPKKKEDKPKEDRKKSGFFKLKMFGH